ncbi:MULTISPECIES: 50S ribosomal protein L9 [Allobranchiibius]|uniref:Large ribosomal subunit protein bL9 n=1 Tax=Allobranchiibius huperziae TaxID=1874116 RepID=A0A853DMQ6_9MICO|nr:MULTISPECIES: 50S ribosomal protein L9 [Allobranchiibius]MBO1767362.1 50S ribosomal protein L9 [Allobranchiibius sp. GilTou38]NYJ76274.1 large subunit ribosomal protein L9 [Allobranchiibius huperziae]UIJ35634.1 50S ribosomal protein L9 [Allobranchiibius sp. GilTou73]
MKLILTHEVPQLGAAGDVVEVKDGYGRNYLLPRGFATQWTKGGQKQVESITRARATRAVKNLEDAQALKVRLESATVTLPVRAGGSGRLYGAVTSGDIADAVQAAGAGTVDRRTIQVTTPIRSLGAHAVQVRLHPEVQADLKLDVVASK